MRRHKRDRDKPIPVGDLQQIAKFRAEMEVYARLMRDGKTHEDAMHTVWRSDDSEDE